MPQTETPPESVLTLLRETAARPQTNGHAARNGVGGPDHDDEAVETPHVAVVSDLGVDGQYGRRWLIVDKTYLRVFSVSAETEPAPANRRGLLPQKSPLSMALKRKADAPALTRVDGSATLDLELELTAIEEASTDTLVGTGVLQLRLKDATVVEALRYTTGLGARFSTACRIIQAYLKGEEPSESLTDDLDQKACPKCGDPLPDDSSVCVKCIDKRATMRRLFRYCLPYKLQGVAVIVLTFLGIGVQMLPPVFQQHLVDDVLVPHRHENWIGWIVFGVFAVNALGIALTVWRGRVAAYISNHMVLTLRTQVFARLQQLSIGYYDKRQTGSLLTRVTQDVNELQSFMVDGIQFFFVNSLQIILTFAILCHYNWKISFYVLLPLPITVLLVRKTFKLLWGRLHRLYFLRSSLGSIISATLSGVRVVKAFAQELRETERFRERATWLFDAGLTVEQSWATYFPILNFITTIGTFILWYAGGLEVFANVTNQATHGRMTIGILMMFLTYVQMVLAPIQGMTRIADWLSRASASAERVFEVLDTEPDVANVAEPVKMPHIEGKVELRNVRFSYDKNRDVLEDVSVIVEPGEMIGLVGHSGAGKSTLINLLSRFYDVREGQILIDGVDIREIDINDVRRQIGVVLQEPFLFPGTVSDNIAYARPGASAFDIMRAAKAANAHEFIMRFPDAYDTYVGERGVRLSGGERQRISIARAILHDPRILILDEATASVDTETEKKIQEAIGRLITGRTTFAIAHRLSTLRNASRLMVIERGKLVELGTHDELLAKPDGIFKKLVDMQREVNQMREDMSAVVPE